jgi:hypothetical protein
VRVQKRLRATGDEQLDEAVDARCRNVDRHRGQTGPGATSITRALRRRRAHALMRPVGDARKRVAGVARTRNADRDWRQARTW